MRPALVRMREVPPAKATLKSAELYRFQDVLDDPTAKQAINAFLAVLERPDVLFGIVIASALEVPGIVPVCLALADDHAFQKAAKTDSRLRKLLGLLLRVRLADLGLEPSGRKGRVSRWTDIFRLGEIYRATEQTASLVAAEGDKAGHRPFFLP